MAQDSMIRVMCALLWLASYPHGTRRGLKPADSTGSRAQRSTLPQEPWFAHLCNHHDVDIDAHFDVRCALVVHGAVVVGQGQLHDILSTRSQQYSLLWEYYYQPLDAASLLIF